MPATARSGVSTVGSGGPFGWEVGLARIHAGAGNHRRRGLSPDTLTLSPDTLTLSRLLVCGISFHVGVCSAVLGVK